MSAARTATASWAGFMSLLPKTASGTKRAGSSWRERWFERVRASKSTSLQTTHEPLAWMKSSPLSCYLCTARHHLQTLWSVKSWLGPTRPSPSLTRCLCLKKKDCCWLCSCGGKKVSKCHRAEPPKQLGTHVWSCNFTHVNVDAQL